MATHTGVSELLDPLTCYLNCVSAGSCKVLGIRTRKIN